MVAEWRHLHTPNSTVLAKLSKLRQKALSLPPYLILTETVIQVIPSILQTRGGSEFPNHICNNEQGQDGSVPDPRLRFSLSLSGQTAQLREVSGSLDLPLKSFGTASSRADFNSVINPRKLLDPDHKYFTCLLQIKFKLKVTLAQATQWVAIPNISWACVYQELVSSIPHS